ncbi:MAG TPA: flagellar hook capping FlgD N-terminal domain-containing protein [Anaerovoracaceae bacterium]|nr:flagellar hook capping FlgD N-terminal domain-containing protein [Anaerovoracaceae bacterium]
MSVNGVNPYQQTASTMNKTSGNNALGMDDFLKLIVAQLSNQDMFNTVDDTQFISQMAQFSMVQALSELSQASATAYSVSLIGKEATVAKSGQNGELNVHTGIVDSVALYNGEPQITIDGEKYALSSVMEVKEPKIIIPSNGIESEDDNDE